MIKMINKKGFTVVEILVVVVILAAVGLIITLGVIPRVEKNAKENFVDDGKLYLQAATKYFSDSKISGEDLSNGCISISDLNKSDVGVTDKNSYKGFIKMELLDDGSVSYNIAIINKKFYSYNSKDKTYIVESRKFSFESVLDKSSDVKDFPTKCLE